MPIGASGPRPRGAARAGSRASVRALRCSRPGRCCRSPTWHADVRPSNRLALAHRPTASRRWSCSTSGKAMGSSSRAGGAAARCRWRAGPGALLIALDERLPPGPPDRHPRAQPSPRGPCGGPCAAAAALQRRAGVRAGMRGRDPATRWSERLAAGGTPHGRLSTGDRLTVDSIRLRVLWPDPNRVPERPPDGEPRSTTSRSSCSARSARSGSMMGDVEDGVDPRAAGAGIPSVDLLKVAHHGSRTASTQAFLGLCIRRSRSCRRGSGMPTAIQRRRPSNGSAQSRATRTGPIWTARWRSPSRAMRCAWQRAEPGPRRSPEHADSSGNHRGWCPDRRSGASDGGACAGPSLVCPAVGRDFPVDRHCQGADGAPGTAFAGGRFPGQLAAARAGAGLPALGHLRDHPDGEAMPLAYHRADGLGSGIGHRDRARDGSLAYFWGDDVWPRGVGRDVPEGRHPLPGRPAGPVATRRLIRPPPR